MFGLELPILFGGAGAVLIGIGGVYVLGRSHGKAGERQRQSEASAEARDTAREIDDAISGMTDAERREELSRWSAR
ncbi:hypothetical protein [Aurantimonas coralicida]|uniref:hypothetical protein n=1 Tax=Aurantimonas coralicida TaxID=182270 RepID=UPI001E4CBA7F|nr:hypothetical protein [Aurantimonas coralicida]MCD1644173.1 hypothetical protein [Aurantimonas coralicida]